MQFQIKKVDFIYITPLTKMVYLPAGKVGINVRDGWHTLKIENEWNADLSKIN